MHTTKLQSSHAGN